MRTGKFQKNVTKKNNSSKIIPLLLSLVLLVCCCIGGTVAWLMDTTDAVTNTFTIGDIELTLVESPYNADGTYGTSAEGVTNNYPLIPGNTYKKDPKVTVKANSEDCYLFVRMEKVNTPESYLNFSFNSSGWTKLDSEEDVYYRVVSKSTTDQSWDLLSKGTGDFTITVKENIVKAGTASNDTIEMPTAEPKLVFTAYAVQKANLSLDEAWALVDPTT